jgi:uncharacterized protein YecE (DUF72 family)
MDRAAPASARAGSYRSEVIRYGPAGFEYDDWAGIVYPKPEPRGFDRLRHLATWFDTVEVNATFYRPFPETVAARWAERVADRAAFRFGVKLWRRFTHERSEAYGAEEVAQARATPDRLKEEGKLGAVLLQFPWSFRRTGENEEWLRGLYRAFEGLPLVLEVRHESWDADEVYAELAEAGVGFVNVDQPLFRRSIKPSAVVTSPVAYVRVHGRNFKEWFRKDAGRDARYDYLYTADELEPWAQRVERLADAPGTPDVYVVTNNHFRGQAVANAKMLESLVTGRKVEAPPELVMRYEAELRPFVAPSHGSHAPGP